MSQREADMGREEIAVWLEEMAGQLRNGTLIVDGEGLPVPEESRARLKSKSKDGRRGLRLELEWPDEEQPSKGKKPKKGKKKQSTKGVGTTSTGSVESTHTGCGNGHEAGCKVEARNEAGDESVGKEKCGNVRDYDSHVLVCEGGDCSKKGGKETRKRLKSELRAAGMNGDVRIDSVECLGLCKQGPNMIVYPEGSWYLGLKERDVPEVVEEHLKNGEPVDRLTAERRPRKKKARS